MIHIGADIYLQARSEPDVNYPYWIREGKLAGSRFPTKEIADNIRKNGIRHVFNLTMQEYEDKDMFDGINLYNLKIEDFSTPSQDVVNTFFQITEKALEKDEPVLVHCWAGCGRTGTMLALWLMRFEGMTADDAINEVRRIRPCALETPSQLNFVRNYRV